MSNRRKGVLVVAASVAALIIGGAAIARATGGDGEETPVPGATRIPQPSAAELAAAGLDELPLAPESDRVDLVVPTFSNPTRITNPLFPISDLHATVLAGRVDGKPFKTETTLLPGTAILEWPEGRRVETLVSQYVAYLDGRIEEVALDHYAQSDDGSVWYLGEDVFNYDDGLIADTDGTWFAGADGPAAMIMPAHPRVGDVYRPENAAGLVFEQVTVKAVDRTVRGPHGPVEGALIAAELHAEGLREDKTFAPGYGEFFTGAGDDVEAMALAVPTDRLDGPVPAELTAIAAGASRGFDQAGAGDWKAASATIRAMTRAWDGFRATGVPPRLAPRLSGALESLAGAVAARNPAASRHASIDVAQGSLDLLLRHRPPAEVDRRRFELWARQLLVDAEAEDEAGVMGDLATLEWIRDRFVHTFRKVDAIRIDTHLVELRAHVGDGDLRQAAVEVARLRATLAGAKAVGG